MRKMHDSSNTACTVCVERASALEIGAERLLDDDVRVLVEPCRAEHRDDRAEGRRRDRQMVQEARAVPPIVGLRLADRVEERLRVARDPTAPKSSAASKVFHVSPVGFTMPNSRIDSFACLRNAAGEIANFAGDVPMIR